MDCIFLKGFSMWSQTMSIRHLFVKQKCSQLVFYISIVLLVFMFWSKILHFREENMILLTLKQEKTKQQNMKLTIQGMPKQKLKF